MWDSVSRDELIRVILEYSGRSRNCGGYAMCFLVTDSQW
jgi:hypothetical protein